MKRAFRQLSEQRVQDTLLAEADELIPIIENFRDGKSEHNPETLRKTVGDIDNYATVVQSLVDVGFLEEFGANHKIPMLYRDGLRIRQGRIRRKRMQGKTANKVRPYSPPASGAIYRQLGWSEQ